MSLLDLITPRRDDRDPRVPRATAAPAGDPVYPTKALRKFVSSLTRQDTPVLLDLARWSAKT